MFIRTADNSVNSLSQPSFSVVLLGKTSNHSIFQVLAKLSKLLWMTKPTADYDPNHLSTRDM